MCLARLYSRLSAGFNLVEAAIVLGVVGLVIGGIWVAASAASDNQKVSQTVADLLFICDKTTAMMPRSMASTGGTTHLYSGSLAIPMALTPPTWVNGSELQSPIGGVVTMQQKAIGNIHNSRDIGGSISIYLNQVPLKYCLRLLPMLNTRSNQVLDFIWVGEGNATNDNFTSYTSYDMPYSGDVMSGCGTFPLTRIEINCKAR